MMVADNSLDRLAMRVRPVGNPVMHQNWERLLFLHWPVEPSMLRPMIPPELEIDLYDNHAWLGITPFAMAGVRVAGLPEIPGLNSFLELNVRTYVHYDGMPGVYFFSLDASKIIPTLAARLFYGLPYFKAAMEFSATGPTYQFNSRRYDAHAEFSASWNTGRPLGEARFESLEFFLVERYGLFVKINDSICLVRIHHRPWLLEEAMVVHWRSSLASAPGLPESAGRPLAHFSHFLSVDTWEPQAL